MKVVIMIFILNLLAYGAIAQEVIMANNVTSKPVMEKIDDEATAKNKGNKTQFSFSKVSHSDELAKMDNIIGGYFNEEIEKKYQLFNSSYAYDVPQVPGSLTTHTVIQKPVIYSAVSKVYKYYKTESKKGRMNKEVAEMEYSYVLDVALTVLYCDTEVFEEELRKIKEPEAMTSFLQNVELTD